MSRPDDTVNPTGCDCAPEAIHAADLDACPAAWPLPLTRRDCAILRAVAEGRCMVSAAFGTPLTVDGYAVSDQFTVARLARAGLITTEGPVPTRALLTAEGRDRLRAA
jgi:hypothetical protein